MIALPEWVKKWGYGSWVSNGDKQMYEALAIAWEALDKIKGCNSNCGDCEGCLATSAMRRITELGKE